MAAARKTAEATVDGIGPVRMAGWIRRRRARAAAGRAGLGRGMPGVLEGKRCTLGRMKLALRLSCVETSASYGGLRCVRRPEPGQEKRDDAETSARTGDHRLPGV
jgi:hypothetical protein